MVYEGTEALVVENVRLVALELNDLGVGQEFFEAYRAVHCAIKYELTVRQVPQPIYQISVILLCPLMRANLLPRIMPYS